MCLTSVIKKDFDPTVKRIGYKIFTRSLNEDCVSGLIYGCSDYRFNCEYDADACSPPVIIHDNDNKPYESGFHIWSKLDDALKDRISAREVVCKVEFSEIVAFGLNKCYGHYKDCFVAKRMTILERIA